MNKLNRNVDITLTEKNFTQKHLHLRSKTDNLNMHMDTTLTKKSFTIKLTIRERLNMPINTERTNTDNCVVKATCTVDEHNMTIQAMYNFDVNTKTTSVKKSKS